MAGKIATKLEQTGLTKTWARRKETDATSVETGGATKTVGAVKAGNEAVEEGTGITKFLLDNSADGNPVSVKALVSLTAPQKESKKKGKKRGGPTLAERWANSPEWQDEPTEAAGEMGGGSPESES